MSGTHAFIMKVGVNTMRCEYTMFTLLMGVCISGNG